MIQTELSCRKLLPSELLGMLKALERKKEYHCLLSEHLKGEKKIYGFSYVQISFAK